MVLGAIGFGFGLGLLYLWSCISLIITYSTVRRCCLFSYFDRNNVVIKSHRTDSDIKFLKYTVVRNTGSSLIHAMVVRQTRNHVSFNDVKLNVLCDRFFYYSWIVAARKMLGGRQDCVSIDRLIFFLPSLQ